MPDDLVPYVDGGDIFPRDIRKAVNGMAEMWNGTWECKIAADASVAPKFLLVEGKVTLILPSALRGANNSGAPFQVLTQTVADGGYQWGVYTNSPLLNSSGDKTDTQAIDNLLQEQPPNADDPNWLDIFDGADLADNGPDYIWAEISFQAPGAIAPTDTPGYPNVYDVKIKSLGNGDDDGAGMVEYYKYNVPMSSPVVTYPSQTFARLYLAQALSAGQNVDGSWKPPVIFPMCSYGAKLLDITTRTGMLQDGTMPLDVPTLWPFPL